MSHVSKEIWESIIQGWNIVDCAVRNRDSISLCLRKDVEVEVAERMWDHDIESRLLNIFVNQDENMFGARTYTGLNKPRVGACTQPVSQGMMVARNNDGQVVLLGGGRKFDDEFIDPGKVPMTWRVKTIGGYAYSVGGARSIYKRQDVAHWVKLDQGFPEVEVATEQGFEDMDAFSESDMYAVGGHGDVWHFDGSTWRQQGFPTNEQLGTVTCGGDGNVYITSEGGSLWVGQKSTWRLLEKRGSSVLWNDAVWFDGKLWLSSDYKFATWNGKGIESVQDEQGEEMSIFGHMDARDGLLAIASPWVVKTFDGQRWRDIVVPY